MATLVFEHSHTAGCDRLGETLRDHGHRMNFVRLHQGDPVPSSLENVDAVITCGGPFNIQDNPDWLEPQMDLLRQANALALPIVGICLGCQILAKALGGEVGELKRGMQLGWHDVKLNHIGREDPIYAGIAWNSMQAHWNRQGVTKLPDGARVLASSEKCPVEAWAMGLRTYGLQYHPEIYADTFSKWAADDPKGLEEVDISAEDLSRQTEMLFPTFERLSKRLFESIALLVMPVDRRYQGVVKDLHH